MTAIVLVLVVPVVGIVIIATRGRTWVADHPVIGRRFGIVGGTLGFAVAAYEAGRFLGLW